MAADAQTSHSLSPLLNDVGFPNEIIANILLHSSTPTFIQLTRTSKQFQTVARSSRQVLLHHLQLIPGDKAILDDAPTDNEKLFLLVRQRAANHLYGVNFTANMHEHVVKNAKLDPSASSISGLDADYVRMALVYKDSADIRQYTNHGSIKEKIETCLGPNAMILKLVQWARWVSVLCRMSRKEDSGVIEDAFSEPDSDSDGSDVELADQITLKPTANSQLAKFFLSQQDAKVGFDRRKTSRNGNFDYRIVHFDVYTVEDSQTFTVVPHLNYIPRDFAVYSTTNCAVLWDRPNPKGRPTDSATVVTYTATKPQLLYPVKYEEKVVWPKAGKPERANADSDDDDTPEYLPERISFFKEGRRIKLYDSGSVVPYEILSSTTTQHDQYASTNILRFDGFSFHVDTPFFGTHATYWDEMSQHSFCFVTHLCLGTATVDVGDDEDENEVRVLCILRSQSRLYPENCEHRVSLQRMTHVSAGNSTVVARLWGFEELQTNLTGKEIVAVSQGGTRIAIAMWNKVYIYPINPKVLCEDVVVDSSDDEVKTKKKKKKSKKPWSSTSNSYYQRRKDQHLLGWKVAEIRPIVLDLNGAVAYKMNWSPAKGPITDTYVPEPVIVIREDANDDETIEVVGSSPTEQEGTTVEGSSDVTVVEASANNEVENTSSDFPTNEVPTAQNGSEAILPGPDGSESTDAEQIPYESFGVVKQTVTGCQVSASGEELNGELNTVNSGTLNVQQASLTMENLTTPVLASAEDVVISTSASNENVELIPPPLKPNASTTSPTSIEMTPSLNGPSSPTTNALPTLNHVLPLHPSPMIALTQPAKPSLKRKDKGSDVNNSEITVSYVTEKEKEKSVSTQILAETKSNSDVSAPPSPTLSKTIPKPKQTVSEALSTGPITPQPPAQQPPTEMSTTVSTEVVSPTPEMNQQTEDIPAPQCSSKSPSSVETLSKDLDVVNHPADGEAVIASTADATDSDPSKTAISKVADSQPVNDRTNKEDENEKALKRKKRITEDELVILTDRGVQVWNVGARAKGKRKKSILPLEESLKGKLPSRKGKAKATVEEHESDLD